MSTTLDKYADCKTKLSLLSDSKIKQIILSMNKNCKNKLLTTKTWGLTKVCKLKGFNEKIFIKAIPIAHLFWLNSFDTSNLYNVPSYYNYGFGSAGINPWRELIAHIITTNFVLTNECNFFPLLYHYRIIADDNNDNIESGLDDRLMKRWENNKNIKKYLSDRIKSKYKIVMFLEYIDNVAYKYLESNNNFIEEFYKQTLNIIKFCKKHGISHNDAHLGNYLINSKNKIVYLTDFGLTLCDKFDLKSDEIKFMKNNAELDKTYAMDNIISDYANRCFYNKSIYKKYNLKKYPTSIELYEHLINNIDIIKNDVELSDFQFKFINKNKKLILQYIKWKRGFKNATNKLQKTNFLATK